MCRNELPQYVVMLKKLNLTDNEIAVIPDGVGGIGEELAHFEIRNNKLKVHWSHKRRKRGLIQGHDMGY